MESMKHESIKHMIELLSQKNSYLIEFQKLNNEELVRIKNSEYQNLEAFYYDRELLLNAIGRIDEELKQYKVEDFTDVSEESKRKVIYLLKNKRQFLMYILNQDMQIHEQLGDRQSLDTEEDKIA